MENREQKLSNGSGNQGLLEILLDSISAIENGEDRSPQAAYAAKVAPIWEKIIQGMPEKYREILGQDSQEGKQLWDYIWSLILSYTNGALRGKRFPVIPESVLEAVCRPVPVGHWISIRECRKCGFPLPYHHNYRAQKDAMLFDHCPLCQEPTK